MTDTTISKNKVEKIIFALLCLLLFYPPFFRGMFFEKELLPTHIFSFILGITWIIINFKNKEYRIVKTPVDIFALGFVFMYFISIFYAVNIRLAILEALKYMNFFVIYLLGRDIVKDGKRRRIIFNVLIGSAFIVCVIGIGSAIGSWNYNGAYVGNRINSTFQYPNTLASYLGAIFVIVISMLLNEKNRKIKAIYGFFAGIIMFTFILTYSRGMWLVFPFVLIIYILLMPNYRKLEAFIYLAINIMISIPFAFLFERYIENSQGICWIIVIGTGLLSTILTYLTSNLEERIKRVSIKKIFISFLIVTICLGVFTLFAINTTIPLTFENNTDKDYWSSLIREIGEVNPNSDYKISINYNAKIKEESQYAGRVIIQSIDEKGQAKNLKIIAIKDINQSEVTEIFTTEDNMSTLKILLQNYYKGTSIKFNEVKILDSGGSLIKNVPLKYKYIPEKVVSRINTINLREHSSQGRLTFYKDAMKIIKNYPAVGSGGGGWISLYKIYQSYNYESTQAHNYYLQVLIEVGIVGLLLFITFIVCISVKIYQSYKRSKNGKKIFINGVYTAVLSILVHAIMDFDLSLCALTFVLWLFFGMLSSIIEHRISLSSVNKYVKFIVATVLSICILIPSSFFIGTGYAEKAVESYKKEDIKATIKNFEIASKLYPYNPRHKIDLANIYKIKLNTNKDYILKARKLMDDAFELVKYDSKYMQMHMSNIANFFFSIGDIEKGLECINQIVNGNPMNVESYLIKSKAYLQVTQYYLNQKKDVKKAKEVLQSAYKIKDEIREVNEVALKPLKYNEDLLSNIGFIQFYNENIEKSDYPIDKGYELKFAYYFDLDIDNNGKIDKLETWSSKEGNISYDLKNEGSLFIRIINSGQKYGVVYPYGINLKPNTNYKIFFKGRGTAKDGTFKFYLRDNKSSKKNQGGLENIKLKEHWEVFSCNIKTTSDINANTPYLGFFHYGKDDGYMDVEEVFIFEEK